MSSSSSSNSQKIAGVHLTVVFKDFWKFARGHLPEGLPWSAITEFHSIFKPEIQISKSRILSNSRS